MHHAIRTAAAILSTVLLTAPLLRAADGDKVDFAKQILPLLSEKCFVCHGPDGEAKDAIRLDSFAGATDVKDGRQGIDPEHPEKSQVLLRIHSSDEPMPPEDAEKQLTEAERALLSRWVREGGSYAKHWAFTVPQKRLPANGKAIRGSQAIDAFVSARLQQQSLKLAPASSRRVLARRAALVLTGLPPDPNQLRTFIADESADAYERYVDQLLQSPRYGEHQARYWLDAVRYGDTHGLHLDNRRGIYPYRDWVVTAFNDNLSFDKFIKWQLAGDLVPNPTLEQLTATGFVRMNPTTAEGGAIPAEFQAKNNFDRVETLGTVFLGLTLTCARCHTHKYDPIAQTEYYRLLAFFNSTAEHSMDGNKYEYGPVIKAPANVDAWRQWKQLETGQRQVLQQADKQANGEGVAAMTLKKWKAASPSAQLTMLADPKGDFTQFATHQAASKLIAQIAAAKKGFTSTLIAKDLPKPRPTHLLARGEYNLPTGDSLAPGVPAVLGDLPQAAPRNRLGLAQWLTSREHPLVARVLVNRIWQRTFGAGLVRTPEDFGLQGRQPTHPELLDWLAVELHDCGWDLKHMLKLMVMSRTFQQSSAVRSDLDDPENALLARGASYRLDAEVIRDVGLWSSGLLDPHMGGEGVKPYQPKGLWSALMHPASNTKTYVVDSGAKLYRRSLYVYWKRTSPHPMMTLFDAPSRESSCVRRSRTNTSLQSLGLLNEVQRIEMARMLAQRLITQKRSEPERLDLLFTLLASRTPSTNERKACMSLFDSMHKRYQTSPKDAQALLSIGEAKSDKTIDAALHAAWAQVAITVLASDIAIVLY